MRRSCALVLLVLFSWLGGLGEDARAGVTLDVLFQDGTGRQLTISGRDPSAPGCSFGGYYGGSVSTGRCMDVILRTTEPLIGFSVSVTYDTDNRLALGSMYEWKGVGVSFNKAGTPVNMCDPMGGLAEDNEVIGSFDCVITAPWNPPVMPAGTYKVGTIVWDTSRTGGWDSETIAAYIDPPDDRFVAVINGNVVDVSDSVVLSSALLYVLGSPIECGDWIVDDFEECDDGGTTPGDGCDSICQIESGWTCEGEPSVCTEDPTPVPSLSATGVTLLGAAVFGIGIVGMLIAARRRFN